MAYGSGGGRKSMMAKNKKMPSGQKKIASAAEPKNKITGADVKAMKKRKA